MNRRITFDRTGKPVVEEKNKDGDYERVVDAEALSRLDVDSLSLAATGSRRASGVYRKPGRNPYQGATVPESKKLRKRSGLDYLRTLSAEIKKQRRDED